MIETKTPLPSPNNYRQVTASQLHQEFMAITPDEMDKMPDEDILRQFGMVAVVSEPAELRNAHPAESSPHAPETTTSSDPSSTPESEAHDRLRQSLLGGLDDNPATGHMPAPGPRVPSQHAVIDATEQIGQFSPQLGTNVIVTRQVAGFGPKGEVLYRNLSSEPAATVPARETEKEKEHAPAPVSKEVVPEQRESLAARVAREVERNVAQTGYVSDIERNLLSLTRNRTEIFAGPQPEKYARFTNEQLAQIKTNLLDSLASESLTLRRTKRDEQLSDLNPRIEEITQNLINLQLQMQQRHNAAPAHDSLLPTKLTAADIAGLADRIPLTGDHLVPLFSEYNKMNLIFSAMKDPQELQAAASRMEILYSLVTELMLRKAEGWDSIQMNNVREALALEHPALQL